MHLAPFLKGVVIGFFESPLLATASQVFVALPHPFVTFSTMDKGQGKPTVKWRYVKRVEVISEEVIALYRVWDNEAQEWLAGKWMSTESDFLSSIPNDLDLFWLSDLEYRNLHHLLGTGRFDLPVRLDLEPEERYLKWKCPECGTFTVVPIVIGLPNAEDMEASIDGHLILWGCIVHGFEPERPVGCTNCDWTGERIAGRKIRPLRFIPESFNEGMSVFP